MSVQPIPEGYHTVTPYLAVANASEAIDRYTRAFGARERARMDAPGGMIGHAELEVGDSLIMLPASFPGASTTPPDQLGGTSGSIFMYVEDVDAVVKQAVDAGATVTMEVATSSGAIGSGPSPTGAAMSGRSRRTSRTCRPTRWRSGPRLRWPR